MAKDKKKNKKVKKGKITEADDKNSPVYRKDAESQDNQLTQPEPEDLAKYYPVDIDTKASVDHSLKTNKVKSKKARKRIEESQKEEIKDISLDDKSRNEQINNFKENSSQIIYNESFKSSAPLKDSARTPRKPYQVTRGGSQASSSVQAGKPTTAGQEPSQPGTAKPRPKSPDSEDRQSPVRPALLLNQPIQSEEFTVAPTTPTVRPSPPSSSSSTTSLFQQQLASLNPPPGVHPLVASFAVPSSTPPLTSEPQVAHVTSGIPTTDGSNNQQTSGDFKSTGNENVPANGLVEQTNDPRTFSEAEQSVLQTYHHKQEEQLPVVLVKKQQQQPQSAPLPQQQQQQPQSQLPHLPQPQSSQLQQQYHQQHPVPLTLGVNSPITGGGIPLCKYDLPSEEVVEVDINPNIVEYHVPEVIREQQQNPVLAPRRCEEQLEIEGRLSCENIATSPFLLHNQSNPLASETAPHKRNLLIPKRPITPKYQERYRLQNCQDLPTLRQHIPSTGTQPHLVSYKGTIPLITMESPNGSIVDNKMESGHSVDDNSSFCNVESHKHFIFEKYKNKCDLPGIYGQRRNLDSNASCGVDGVYEGVYGDGVCNGVKGSVCSGIRGGVMGGVGGGGGGCGGYGKRYKSSLGWNDNTPRQGCNQLPRYRTTNKPVYRNKPSAYSSTYTMHCGHPLYDPESIQSDMRRIQLQNDSLISDNKSLNDRLRRTTMRSHSLENKFANSYRPKYHLQQGDHQGHSSLKGISASGDVTTGSTYHSPYHSSYSPHRNPVNNFHNDHEDVGFMEKELFTIKNEKKHLKDLLDACEAHNNEMSAELLQLGKDFLQKKNMVLQYEDKLSKRNECDNDLAKIMLNSANERMELVEARFNKLQKDRACELVKSEQKLLHENSVLKSKLADRNNNDCPNCMQEVEALGVDQLNYEQLAKRQVDDMVSQHYENVKVIENLDNKISDLRIENRHLKKNYESFVSKNKPANCNCSICDVKSEKLNVKLNCALERLKIGSRKFKEMEITITSLNQQLHNKEMKLRSFAEEKERINRHDSQRRNEEMADISLKYEDLSHERKLLLNQIESLQKKSLLERELDMMKMTVKNETLCSELSSERSSNLSLEKSNKKLTARICKWLNKRKQQLLDYFR